MLFQSIHNILLTMTIGQSLLLVASKNCCFTSAMKLLLPQPPKMMQLQKIISSRRSTAAFTSTFVSTTTTTKRVNNHKSKLYWGEKDVSNFEEAPPRRAASSSSSTRRPPPSSGGSTFDEEGRRMSRSSSSSRKRRGGGGGGDFEESNDWGGGGGSDGGGEWDDFEVDSVGAYKPYKYSSSSSSKSERRGGGSRGGGRGNDRGSRGGGRDDNRRRRDRTNSYNYDNYNSNNNQQSRNKPKKSSSPSDRKINLRALEGAGFEHLYGLSPILAALSSSRRDFTSPESFVDLDSLSEEDYNHEMKQRERKPEATFAPYLFIQESSSSGGGRKKYGDKAIMAQEVEQLAEKMEVPIARVDRGVLNALCYNRPHQGYVLRCGGLTFEPMSRIPHPSSTTTTTTTSSPSPRLWLVLDEVVDPQNFGALLRSAYFLGGAGDDDTNNNNDNDAATTATKANSKIGIMVCAKNSAPPSPVVSAASAGALELCQVYSTSNLPRTLNAAKADGFRIFGAAASAPFGVDGDGNNTPVKSWNLSNVEWETDVDGKLRPTILVLGSEGHGLRTLVAKACTDFVSIPGGGYRNAGGGGNDDDDDDQDGAGSSSSLAGVDSLNVSVTGGIMLWHFMNSMMAHLQKEE